MQHKEKAMSENTKIEWCDHTFNPWIGCARVSPGCDHCYAAVSTPVRAMKVAWGQSEPRHRTAPGTWKDPIKWNARHAEFFAAHGRRQRVFCASLADVFDNAVRPSWLVELFYLIAKTPNLDWLLLTKRIGNAAEMIRRTVQYVANTDEVWPWANVWLGATIVNQAEADRDIPKLLATPACVRFLSIEPLLGSIDLRLEYRNDIARWDGQGRNLPLRRIDWVIAGGESGPHARPMHPDWARSLRDQCAAAGVPFLFKQWGEWGMPTDDLSALDWPYHKDHDRAHWFDARDCVRPIERGWSEKYSTGGGALPPPPFDLFKTPEYVNQVSRCTQESCRAAGRCVGNSSRSAVIRVGKKAAGRLLDGRTHDEFPEVTQ